MHKTGYDVLRGIFVVALSSIFCRSFLVARIVDVTTSLPSGLAVTFVTFVTLILFRLID